jgi:ribose transport system substrate-binding protein
MKASRWYAATAVIGVGLLVASCSASPGSDPADAGTPDGECDYGSLSIGYANPTATNQGWIIINQGAQDAADEYGVGFSSVGPPQDGDAAGQATVIENFVASGVDALVIAPVDSSALVPSVELANESGIPVVDVDSFIDGGELASFVATDNLAAAAMQAEAVGEAIGGAGKVVLVNGGQGFQTGRDRRDGFVDTMAEKYPDVEVIEVQTEWDAQEAQAGLEDALSANADIVAVAHAWDGATVASVSTLENAGLLDDVYVMGFDGAPDAIALLLAGKVDAIIAQQLYQMGYTAVETAVQAACGDDVEERIDTGVVQLTPENIEQFIDDNPPVLREFVDQAS